MIRVTLEDIQIKLNKLSRDFAKQYGNEKLAEELEKLETSESWTRTTMQTKLHAAFSVHKSPSGIAKRIKIGLIHTPIFREQFEGLADLLSKLESLSITCFIKRDRDGRKMGWEDYVPTVAFRALLESLSGETATVSDPFRASILQCAS